MANSTQEALNLAIQSARDLKKEISELEPVISGIAKNLNTILSFDVTSFKELNKLNKETEKDTNKLTEAVNKKTVAYDKLKVKQSELIKELKQFDREVAAQAKLKKQSDDSQIASEKNKSSQMKAMFGNRKKQLKEESDLSLKRAKDYESASNSVIRATKKEDLERKNAIKQIELATKAKLREEKATKKQKDAITELERPYNKLIGQHKQAKKVLLDLRVAKGKDNALTKKAQTEYDRLSKKVNQANAATRNFAKGGLRSSVIGVRNLLGAFGLLGGVQLFASAVSSAFQLTTALDSIGFSMRAIIKDADELAQTQVFLKKITKDYGAELVTTTNRYVKFRAAAMQAGMSARETQDIFGTMTKAAGVLGLKTDELTGIYLALEQMISKGKVTTEELRRQLGERLPGAMDIMATSLGVTTAELDKMLRAGTVITKDVLPAFARQVEISFGLDKVDKVRTLRAAITRLKNSWSILVDDFAKGGTQVQSLTGLLDHFADNFKTYVNIIIAGAKAFLWYKTMVFAATAQNKLMSLSTTLSALQMRLLGKATISTTKKVVLFNRALKANLLGLIITGLYLAYEAFEYFNKPLGEATKLIKEQTEELKGQVTAYKENTDEVNKMATAYENLVDKGLERTNEETAEMERLFIALAKVAPIVVTDTNEFGVATEIATGKLKEFNKEMKNSLIDRANFNISEQTKELAKYKKVQEDLIKFQKGNFSIAIEDLGYITKKGDAYKKLSSNGVDYIDVTLEEKAAISDYLLKVKEGIETSKKTIETNEDLIGTITGVLTERQKESKALKAQEAGREAFLKHTESQVLLLPKLRKQLVSLRKELGELKEGGIAVGEKEKFDELNKSISDTKKQIEELTGKIKIPKVEGLDLGEIGLDDGQEKLTKYQKDLVSFLETLKETEEVPELMPLSDETLEMLEKYNKALQETKDKGEQLEILKGVFSEVTDTFADMFDIDISKFDFLFDGLENSVEDWAKLSKELIGSVLDASLQSYEIELQEAQIARDVTLDNDLATAEQKEAARKQFDEKERDINTRKAKEERKNNLIKIAVDTAVGVVSAFGNPLKIAAIIALGLSQAAIVASQPLPKFEGGTQNSPEGMATTDEKGAEIHTDKLGNIKDLGSNKGARNKYLEKGDKIFTADQSKNMLERFDANHLQSAIFDMNMVSNGNILSDKAVDRSLLNEVGGLRKDIDKMGLRIQKMASRPISVNNKVEIKQDTAY